MCVCVFVSKSVSVTLCVLVRMHVSVSRHVYTRLCLLVFIRFWVVVYDYRLSWGAAQVSVQLLSNTQSWQRDNPGEQVAEGRKRREVTSDGDLASQHQMICCNVSPYIVIIRHHPSKIWYLRGSCC